MRGLGDVKEAGVIRRCERVAGASSRNCPFRWHPERRQTSTPGWAHLAVGEGGCDRFEECAEAAIDEAILLGGMGRRYCSGYALVPESVK